MFHNPPAELRDVVGQDAGIWHFVHFEALRSGAMRTIDPAAIEGLITFPSFHTALAVVTAWAFWRTRYIAVPALLLNLTVIASTVPVGGHYFVDVFAGAAIAGLDPASPACARRPCGKPARPGLARADRLGDRKRCQLACQEPAHERHELGELVVVHPVPGSLEGDDLGVAEMPGSAVIGRIGGPALLAVDQQGRAGDARP